MDGSCVYEGEKRSGNGDGRRRTKEMEMESFSFVRSPSFSASFLLPCFSPRSLSLSLSLSLSSQPYRKTPTAVHKRLRFPSRIYKDVVICIAYVDMYTLRQVTILVGCLLLSFLGGSRGLTPTKDYDNEGLCIWKCSGHGICTSEREGDLPSCHCEVRSFDHRA